MAQMDFCLDHMVWKVAAFTGANGFRVQGLLGFNVQRWGLRFTGGLHGPRVLFPLRHRPLCPRPFQHRHVLMGHCAVESWRCPGKACVRFTNDCSLLGYIRLILGLYWGNVGIMDKKMETTIQGLGPKMT